MDQTTDSGELKPAINRLGKPKIFIKLIPHHSHRNKTFKCSMKETIKIGKWIQPTGNLY